MAPTTISGIVIHGKKQGKQLGFPTANLDHNEWVLHNVSIPHGIYAGFAILTDTNARYKAGIVIGPNDQEGLPAIEAHLIDFDGDIYGKKITLTLEKFIREFKSYNSEKELIKAIKNDIALISSL